MNDIPVDPFGEHGAHAWQRRFRLLGANCVFRSASRRLMALVEAACAGLPAQRLAGASPTCRFDLRLARGGREFGPAGPPRVRAGAGAGLLTGVIDADNYVVMAPAARAACISMSESLLAQPYHARYELIEFALLALLSRVRGLVPLHAACVGERGAGVMLLGSSGAGKSTLCFHAATQGLRLLAEDSLLVEPRDLVACALPTFVHLRRDGLRWLRDAEFAAAARASAVIRRRSGVRKLEIDLRKLRGARLAGPLRLAAVVCLSKANGGAVLRPIAPGRLARRLSREQGYASAQVGWPAFLHGVTRLPAFELRRGAHPGESVSALRELLRECRP